MCMPCQCDCKCVYAVFVFVLCIRQAITPHPPPLPHGTGVRVERPVSPDSTLGLFVDDWASDVSDSDEAALAELQSILQVQISHRLWLSGICCSQPTRRQPIRECCFRQLAGDDSD